MKTDLKIINNKRFENNLHYSAVKVLRAFSKPQNHLQTWVDV